VPVKVVREFSELTLASAPKCKFDRLNKN